MFLLIYLLDLAYKTRKTVNRLVREQLHLNHVVSERPKGE